jgi:hypothetical protein
MSKNRNNRNNNQPNERNVAENISVVNEDTLVGEQASEKAVEVVSDVLDTTSGDARKTEEEIIEVDVTNRRGILIVSSDILNNIDIMKALEPIIEKYFIHIDTEYLPDGGVKSLFCSSYFDELTEGEIIPTYSLPVVEGDNIKVEKLPINTMDKEIGNGVNSTPEEIKKLGGIEKLRAKIKAKREIAKAAEQPRV